MKKTGCRVVGVVVALALLPLEANAFATVVTRPFNLLRKKTSLCMSLGAPDSPIPTSSTTLSSSTSAVHHNANAILTAATSGSTTISTGTAPPTSTSLASSLVVVDAAEFVVLPTTSAANCNDITSEDDVMEYYYYPDPNTPHGHGMSLSHPSLNFARVLVLSASAVYGTNFAIVKLLDEQMPFEVSAAMRFSLAAVVVTALVFHAEQRHSTPNNKDEAERWPATLAGMEIGAWYCLGYLCQAAGLQTADASKSAFFNALAVIVVPLLDSLFRGKRMGWQGMSSVALAIAGVGLLQLGPSLLEASSSSSSFSAIGVSITNGDYFCLGQALLFGIGYWRLEHISSHHPTQAGRITVGQLVGVALGSTLFCAATTDWHACTQHVSQWLTDPFTLAALAWTALVSTALALYLETVALKAISASELTILMTSVSLFGSAFAYVTMGEIMSPIGMVGGLAILAGCVLSSLGGGGGGTADLPELQLQLQLEEAPALLEATTTQQLAAEDEAAWQTNSYQLQDGTTTAANGGVVPFANATATAGTVYQ